VLVHRSYRHRLRLTPAQERQARRFAGCARLIYNAGLEQRSLGYEVTGRSMSYKRQTYYLKEVKEDPQFAFLNEAPAHVLQQALLDLDRAFSSFFKGTASYPRPRRRGERDGFRFPDPDPRQIGVHDPARVGQVRLPKLVWCSVRNCWPRLGERFYEGELKHASVVREADGWYVSFSCEVLMADPLAPAGPPLGIDAGVARSYATSEGELVHLPVLTDAEWAKIGRLQSVVNRCERGSRNRERALRRLARYRRRLCARKHDELHRLTTRLAKSHPLILIEDLPIKNMTASAKGTIEEPGCNVAQKAGLNRAILDECWGEGRRQLEYKCVWYGSALGVVSPYRTSQECSACGHVAAESHESQAAFRCVACGFERHADINAACNIRERGLAQTTAAQQAPAVSAGGTPVPEGPRTRRACEGRASSKTPETLEPSRKQREQGAGRPAPQAQAILTPLGA
jgi:putative transposase